MCFFFVAAFVGAQFDAGCLAGSSRWWCEQLPGIDFVEIGTILDAAMSWVTAGLIMIFRTRLTYCFVMFIGNIPVSS